MKKIKILLVDDHQVVRKGLNMLLTVDKELEVIEGVSSGEEALSFLEANEVDILLTDITMPKMTGLELLKKVTTLYPDVKTIILSMHVDRDYIEQAMDYGAKGYITKDTNESDIITGVKNIYNGEMFLSKDVAEVLAKSFIRNRKKQEVKREAQLTKRELEVLSNIVEGLSNKMISSKLNISERTVSVHRYNLMKKLDVPNTASLVKKALSHDLVH